jgi:predicted NAD/FAD-binding protein
MHPNPRPVRYIRHDRPENNNVVETLAIIGTGIAGLGCAHALQRRFALTLYEKGGHVGGHAQTVNVEEAAGSIPIDTGFMTYNQVTYPQLTRLFRELGVATQPSSMSFSVQHRPSGLEFCGSSLNLLFGQRRNLLKARFWRMLLTVDRFNREAVATLRARTHEQHSLEEYLCERGYGEHFRDFYLMPMSCAVWSMPPERMLQFPATTLLRFFHNHGFLGLHTQHPWFTVSGGSQRYVEKLIAPFRDCIHLRRGAVAVRREAGRITVIDESGHRECFDRAILACHADQALGMLTDADDTERRVLGHFRYQPNTAVLHTDESVMPATRRCWSSWNYRVSALPDGRASPSTVYWINSLQRPPTRQNYFVSINGEEALQPQKILKRISYDHPLFNLGAVRAQRELPALNARQSGVYFCGSYFRYGFHEDALSSALELSQLLGPALAGRARSEPETAGCAPVDEFSLAGARP